MTLPLRGVPRKLWAVVYQIHHWVALAWSLLVVLECLDVAGGEPSFSSLLCLQRVVIGLTPCTFFLFVCFFVSDELLLNDFSQLLEEINGNYHRHPHHRLSTKWPWEASGGGSCVYPHYTLFLTLTAGWDCYPRFTREQTEAQREEKNEPESHSWLGAEPVLEERFLPNLNAYIFFPEVC